MTAPTTPSPTLPDAFALYRAGRLADAEDAFRRLLAERTNAAGALHGLSLVLEASGRVDAALAAAGEAVALAPQDPGMHYTLGLMHWKQGHGAYAAASLGRAVHLKPEFFQAWNNFGLALQDLGRLDDARRCFERVLHIQPGHAGACTNLASVFQAMDRDDDALACLERGAAQAPDDPASHANLGRLRLRMRRFADAAASFERSLDLEESPRVRKELAEALIGLRRLDAARDHLAAVVAADQGLVAAAYRLGWVLAQMNETDAAIAVYEAIRARDGGDFRAHLGAGLTLPIIHTDRNSLQRSRARFEAALDRLAETPPAMPAGANRESHARQLEWDNFYLAYQGQDDVRLLAQYARVLRQMLAQCTADLPPPKLQAPGRGARVRIGFASAFFRDCTVGHYFQSWITELDGGRFEKFVYMLEEGNDAVAAAIRRAADRHVRLTGSVRDAAAQLVNDALDILVYPELGMHGRTYALAGLRLAPVQCAGWGHPETSGHPTVDYFLSSALMEPDDGQRSYVERLVLLPGLGTAYTPPRVTPRRRRADFGLPEARHLYLLPQSLFKIHPDNDETIARVLAQDAQGILVLFEGENTWLTEAFRQRLDRVLHRAQVDPARVIVLQLLPRDDYLEVNRLCDVMLDTLHWSGGNTTLDALAVGLPVVTRWGALMRGRQSAGMLRALGRDDLIARDDADYVRIALEIARSPSRRAELRDAMLAAHSRLFGNSAPIRRLEDFFESVARQRTR